MAEGGWSHRGRILLVAAGLLAIGLVVGGYLMGDGLRRARLSDRAVTMRGLAERNVTADLATWTIVINEQGTELTPVQQAADRDVATTQDFFRRSGFQPGDISDAGVTVNQSFDSNRNANQVTVQRRLELRTRDVMRARAAFAQQAALIRAGVPVGDGSAMVYSFTGLNAVKPQMIAQATEDARRGAEQFAHDSGTSVGGIRSATQGYFSVGPRDGDQTEGENGGGGHDSPFQKVRVVTTIEFYLD